MTLKKLKKQHGLKMAVLFLGGKYDQNSFGIWYTTGGHKNGPINQSNAKESAFSMCSLCYSTA